MESCILIKKIDKGAIRQVTNNKENNYLLPVIESYLASQPGGRGLALVISDIAIINQTSILKRLKHFCFKWQRYYFHNNQKSINNLHYSLKHKVRRLHTLGTITLKPNEPLELSRFTGISMRILNY